jgi:hypothetical protein
MHGNKQQERWRSPGGPATEGGWSYEISPVSAVDPATAFPAKCWRLVERWTIDDPTARWQSMKVLVVFSWYSLMEETIRKQAFKVSEAEIIFALGFLILVLIEHVQDKMFSSCKSARVKPCIAITFIGAVWTGVLAKLRRWIDGKWMS